MPECEECASRPPEGLSRENAAAVQAWNNLDSFGRPLDSFSGCPMPLRTEAMDSECARTEDPDGIRWRVLLLEDIIYNLRVKSHAARTERKERERSK